MDSVENPKKRRTHELEPGQQEMLSTAWEFVQQFCPRLARLEDPLLYPEELRPLGYRIIRDIIDNDIQDLFLQGPPSAGKTTVIKEFLLLFSFLKYRVRMSLYDEALQGAYQLFSKDDENWSRNPWLLTSALLLANGYESEPPATPAEQKAFFESLVFYIMSRDVNISPAVLLDFLMEERKFYLLPDATNLKRLFEATVVALVKGRDRGQLAYLALAERERMLQAKGLPPKMMVLTLISDPETKQHTKKIRTLAHDIFKLVESGATIETLGAQLEQLRQLGLLFVGMEDLMAWVEEQVIAADPEFIDKYDVEMVEEARNWLTEVDPLYSGMPLLPLRRIQVEETVLPKNIDKVRINGQLISPDDTYKMKLVAACLIDKRFQAGLTPAQSVVAWNNHVKPTLGRKKMLVLCYWNVGRSAMFRGFFNQKTGGNNALSAGVSPDLAEAKAKYNGRTTPNIMSVMAESGIDVTSEVIKGISASNLERLKPDLSGIVVLCRESDIPDFIINCGIPVYIRSVSDPDTMEIDGVRNVRDDTEEIAEEMAQIYKSTQQHGS